MADIVDRKTRSRMMAGIRGKDTKPEMIIRTGLHRKGYRYRLHVSKLPGKPDLFLKKYGAVIMIHGCFWHGHDCHLFKWPQTRPDFWKQKIGHNRMNDIKAKEKLLQLDFRICTVWECALKGSKANPEKVINRIEKWFSGNRKEMEIKG